MFTKDIPLNFGVLNEKNKRPISSAMNIGHFSSFPFKEILFVFHIITV